MKGLIEITIQGDGFLAMADFDVWGFELVLGIQKECAKEGTTYSTNDRKVCVDLHLWLRIWLR